jgi:hypothetical protein
VTGLIMSDNDPELPPVLETIPAPPPPPPPASSLLARLLNVFAIPNHVFDEVRASRHAAGNWLVPMLLGGLALALSAHFIFSMPTAQKQVHELLDKVREAQTSSVAQAVKDGKMTQADADQLLAMVDRMARPQVVQAVMVTAALAYGVVRIFWWAFVMWLLARAFLRAPIPYGKSLEVTGLASMIGVLSSVVLLVLTVRFGAAGSASGLGLSVVEFNSPQSQTVVAVALNLMNFWLVGVLGAGLARLTGRPWIRATYLVFGYWLLSELLVMALGAGAALK